MVRVNLEVPEETKNRWEQAAKNDPNAGGNLSGFIRSAMAKQIERDEPASRKDENSREEITELKSIVSSIAQSLETTNARLRELEDELKGDPEIKQLANDLFSQLPSKDDFEQWHSGEGEYKKLGKLPAEQRTPTKATRGGDPEAFAELLACSQLEIQEAINYLMENTPLVQKTEKNGETRIFRER